MPRTIENGQETVGMATVGQEGEVCAQCGSVLATDQRYCLNCGSRRGEPRVDYETRMTNGAQQAPAPLPAQASGFQQSPLFAVGTIALLGIMLLLGVLIGKDNNGGTQTVAAAPAQTTTTSAAATPTTPTANAAPDKTAKAAAGQGNVEKGGSGSAEGVATVDTQALENAAQSGQGAQAGKNLPNQVATPGETEQLDPNGQAGDGSSATCIGC